MSPRDYAAGVVTERLLMMRQRLSDLAEVGEITPERLASDRLLRHAVERILTQLVTLATDINAHVAATVASVQAADPRTALSAIARAGVISESLATALRPSIGLRNVLVHEYLEIDLRQVAAAAAEAARDYAAYVRDVSAWARSGPETH